MRRKCILPLTLITIFGSSACGSGNAQVAADSAQTQVRISGSGTAMPLVERLAAEYERSHPDMEFVFEEGTNSGGAIIGVQDGQLDLAVVNRELEPEESTGDVSYVPLARDAVAFALGPGVKLDDISTADVRRIYRGEIVNWRQLGLAAGPIVVLDRDADESARQLVLLPFMQGQTVGARTTVLEKASVMADALAGTPYAFGYTAAGYLRAEGIEGVRLLSLDGTTASAATVAEGT